MPSTAEAAGSKTLRDYPEEKRRKPVKYQFASKMSRSCKGSSFGTQKEPTFSALPPGSKNAFL